ncbi:uncharacterized protein LOC119732071 [Patiria miniata]|uniref:Transient receptor ion channel domain-containing protein n=1 Tax=Patiria miniata TaxID=46514 RepID=A0A914ACB5_PATMI|nr:uncharacterized protein LOC119732071 [Patiria miniata]
MDTDSLTQLMVDQELMEEVLLARNEQTSLPGIATNFPAAAADEDRSAFSSSSGESDYEKENARYDELRGVIETGNGLKLGELLAEWQEMGWLRDWRNEENLTLYADAITDGYLDIINALLSFDIPLGDALIRGIDVAFDDAIKAICRYIEAHEDIREDVLTGTSDNDDFHPAVTPLILAAQRNNFSTVKLLIDLGARITEPSLSQGGDVTLTQAISTLHIYRALSQPAYMLATQTDIFGHAFQMSAKLKTLSKTWEDFGAEYEQMARSVEVFAGELLGESSSTEEILALFRYHNTDKYRDVEGKQHPLAKLFEAIKHQQKEFIAHPHSQKAIIVQFYRNLLDWNERGLLYQVLLILFVLLGYPIICLLYIFVPTRRVVQFARLPYVMMMMKAGSGFTFLLFIVIGTVADKHTHPRTVELLHNFMLVWVIGLAWLHIKMIAKYGCGHYVGDSVNLHELAIMVLYFTVFILQLSGGGEAPDDNPMPRSVRDTFSNQDLHDLQDHVTSAVNKLRGKLNDSLVRGVDGILLKALSGCRPRGPTETALSSPSMDVGSSFQDHLHELEETIGLSPFDPSIVAGALFGVTITVAVLCMLNLLLVSNFVGPLRISLGNMTGDIIKFCGIFLIIWIAFAIGLFQNFYSAGQSATRSCIEQGEEPASCQLLVGFSTFLSSVKDLYWSLYGFIGIDVFQLPGKHSVAEGVGTFLFIGYLIVAVLVLLNALIGMLSNTYNRTEENADTEWKFHRAAVWASYLRPVGTLPPPFNLIPSLKTLYRIYLYIVGLRRKPVNRKEIHSRKEIDDYDRVLQLVSHRYIQANLSTESQNNENARPRDLQTLRNDILAFKFNVQDRLKHLDSVLGVTNEKTSTVHQKLDDLRPIDVRAEELLDHSSHLTDRAATLFDETGTLKQTQEVEISERDKDAAKMRDTIAKLRGEIADLISSHLAEVGRRDRLETGLNNTILELNGTIGGLQDEIEQLGAKHSEELAARDKKEEQLTETILNLQEDSKCLTDKVQTLSQTKDDLEFKVTELHDKIGDLEIRHGKELTARDKKEEELTDAILNLREENKFLSDKVPALEQEKADLENKVADLSKKTSPKGNPSTLSYTIAAHKVEIENLTGSHAKEMVAKNTKEAKLNKTISDLQEKNRTLNDNVERLGEDKARLEKECSESRDDLVALQFRIEEIKSTHIGELWTRDQQNAKLADDIGRLQKENTALKETVSELDENEEELTQTVNQLREEADILHAESSTLKKAVTRLQEEIEHLKTLHSAELTERDHERENLKELNSRLQADVSCLEDNLRGVRQERDQLSRQVSELGEGTAKLEQSSSKLEDNVAALRSEIKELTNSRLEEIKEKERQEAELNDVIRGFQEEKRSLLNSLQRLKEDKAELAKFVGDLNMEFTELRREQGPTPSKEGAHQIEPPVAAPFGKNANIFGNNNANNKKGPRSGNDTEAD